MEKSNGKPHQPENTHLSADLLNPFVHRLELDTTYDKLKTAFLTVALLPFRLAAITALVIMAWLLACLGLHGLTEDDLRRAPLTGWRRVYVSTVYILMVCVEAVETSILRYDNHGRKLILTPVDDFEGYGTARFLDQARGTIIFKVLHSRQDEFPTMSVVPQNARLGSLYTHHKDLRVVVCWVIRAMFICGGWHRLKVKGEKAPCKDAPVLALAPHSSFFDALTVVYLGGPSIVAKTETSSIPFFGKLINYTQPVYVWREDPNSRQNTIKEIIERATSKEDWPQVMIFPEGTCTNRSCLITFKSGAFYPGVPIQPVCIRYPNKLDTVTWTWEGPGALKLLWLTLTQLNSSCEIEFLPVYKPSEAEKTDPKLYANNVRRLMAKALQIPVSDYTYDDCRIISKAHQLNLKNVSTIIETHKLRYKLGLLQGNTEENILEGLSKRLDETVDLHRFSEILRLNEKDPVTRQLFHIHDPNGSGFIDMEEYIFTVMVVAKADSVEDMIKIALKLRDPSEANSVDEAGLRKVLKLSLHVTPEEANRIFRETSSSKTKRVNSDDLIECLGRKSEYSYLIGSSSEERRKKSI